MRAGEILDAVVYSSDGEKVGHVYELHGSKSGSQASDSWGPSIRIDELHVGSRAALMRLGYRRSRQKGPLLFRLLAGRSRGFKVTWDQIDDINRGSRRIDLRSSRSELKEL